MKKVLLLAGLAFATQNMNAQISEGNWMVGGQVANMKFTNGFDLSLTPQLGYFIKDNWAIGGKVGIDIEKPTGSGTNANIDISAFTRYYFGQNEINTILKNGKFFAEGTVGLSGINQSSGATTNGVGLGIGAGYSYFITQNVGLEGLVKFDGVAGGGNQNFNGNVSLNVGFQIYIPSSKLKQALKDKQ